MGEKTGISWCDHTFNPWIGCTKVSQGCKFCYAERENERYHWADGWGKNVPRRRTSEANWRKPMQWAHAAGGDHTHRRVFCASLADIFDDEVPEQWRQDLWDVIKETLEFNFIGRPTDDIGLEWLILTKRPENIAKMLPGDWIAKPPKWVRLGVSIEDQTNIKRLEQLLQIWKGNNFISVEPLLGPIEFQTGLNPNDEDWEKINEIEDANDEHEPEEFIEECEAECDWVNFGNDLVENPEHREWRQWRNQRAGLAVFERSVHWVIVGGESGPDARPMHPDWVRAIRDLCQLAKIPFFFKQWGEWALSDHYFKKIGRKAAGRILDGRTWEEFPEVE